MALIKCSECGHEISDKAEVCPKCGAPVLMSLAPISLKYDRDTDTFKGTMIQIVKLAMHAIEQIGWKLDQANETLGLVTFETGMSWGSWSGISCSLNITEVSSNTFRVTGTGKQNVRGGQIIAFNIGNEAQGKADKAIQKMKELAI